MSSYTRQIKPVEEMDWEKEFDKGLMDTLEFECQECGLGQEGEEITIFVKDFIRKALTSAVKGEQERIAEEIKGTSPKMPDELFDMVDDYDDYRIGYIEAKYDSLKVIQEPK